MICKAYSSYCARERNIVALTAAVTNERETVDAIVEASNYPLSIIMVGVGDGYSITHIHHHHYTPTRTRTPTRSVRRLLLQLMCTTQSVGHDEGV
jgi:hypothetical protein